MFLNRSRLRRRVVDIAYRRRLSHLSSCLTSVGILCDIYESRRDEEAVVLSNGHAGLALYVLLEAVFGLDAEDLESRHGTHPRRCAEDHVDVSTGSLGMGLPIALGMALANRGRRVHCVVSDGECAEGSIWEALAARARLGADNLHVVVNMNGFSAYDSIDLDVLEARLRAFDANIDLRRTRCELPFAKGYAAHYHILSEAEYRWLIEHDEVAE